MFTRIGLVLVGTYLAVVLGGSFMYNLPTWCANPQGQGNWIIAPLCK